MWWGAPVPAIRWLRYLGHGYISNPTVCAVYAQQLTSWDTLAGLLKTQALRGTMRDVQTDERTAFAFDMYQACTEQLLQWVYPPLYPVHDTSTPWGKPDESGRCVPTYRLLLSSIDFPHAEPLSPFIAH